MLSSPDLVNWKKHERILDTAALNGQTAPCGHLLSLKKYKNITIFFGANDIQTDNEKGGIGVAVADRPEGPFKDHLGKPLVDKFHNGAQPIDQFVFKRWRWKILPDLRRLETL